MSMLRWFCSDDRTRADDFEPVFGGTHLGRQPTENRHRYVVLRFDFSAFDDTLETLRERFETYCHLELDHALRRNQDLFPQEARQRILSLPSIDTKLNELFLYAGDHGIPPHVLIDEYDNFANTVLAHRGAEAYQSFTQGGGFYRNFFATLKAGAGRSDGGLERLFITGVLPITMDDVTSGFNIGSSISLESRFDQMLGFTEEEVREVLAMYLDERENFLSLLHYFGLFSIRDVAHGIPRLGIPNQTVKRLMYGYLRDGLRDVEVFSISAHTFARLMRQMAFDGAWQPVLDFLRDALVEQTGIRDYMDGEKVVHCFVAAYLSLVDQFLLHSEYELNKGYADLYLEPFLAQYPDVGYGYVLELKYLKRSEAVDDAVVTAKV